MWTMDLTMHAICYTALAANVVRDLFIPLRRVLSKPRPPPPPPLQSPSLPVPPSVPQAVW